MSNDKQTQSIHGTSKRTEAGKQLLVFEWTIQGKKEAIVLHKKRAVIGAVVSSDVRIDGKGVAPIHAVVEIDVDPVSGKDHAVIYDIASATGLWVNQQKVVTKALENGDQIQIGDVSIRFDLKDLDSFSVHHPFNELEGRKLFVQNPETLGALLLVDEHEVEEIFDYKSTQKKSTEVIFSWMDTVLDTRHFVDEKKFNIGSGIQNAIGVPGLKGNDPFALLDHQGDDFILNVPSQMDGVIQRDGKVAPIAPLGRSFTLRPNDLVKLVMGDLNFYVSLTSAPPTLKRKRILERDPVFFRILSISGLLTALLLFTLFQLKPSTEFEVEEVPERVATILYQPEKYIVRRLTVPEDRSNVTEPKKEEPKADQKKVTIEIQPKNQPPKKVPKEMNVAQQQKAKPKMRLGQNEAKEGAGARAKGAEGRRGTKNASKTNEAQNRASRTSPEAGTGLGGSESQVADQGNVNLLKGAVSQIEDVLGASAEKLGKGGSKLKGFGGFDTQGNGGLALSGTGRGGGGDAAGLGGLGNKGRGGGRVGTGMGAAGSGSGIIGGKTRVELRRGGPEETVVMGSIDPSLIEAAILEHKDEFRLCYEKEINAENPNQAGRVGTSFVIGASGRVNQAGIVSSSLHNPNTERCILTVLKRIQFPIPRGAGIVEVKYPFKFSSG